MYIDTSKSVQRGKTYIRHLLRESYREDGKTKHRTIAKLSSCSDKEIAAMKLALKHKDNLSILLSDKNNEPKDGMRVGALLCLNAIAERLGITKALGDDKNGKRALWQVIARLLDHGSQLSVGHLATTHSVRSLLGIRSVNEPILFRNMKWLSVERERIEKQLFEIRHVASSQKLFLYYVTNSYLDGTNVHVTLDKNKQKGDKLSLAIGVLSDQDGCPISMRVFAINTNDPKSLSQQIDIIAKSFSIKDVILVGDWQMLKTTQRNLDNGYAFHYITAITKAQIQKLCENDIFQNMPYWKYLGDVKTESVRYIIGINPESINAKILIDYIQYVIETDVPDTKLAANIIDEQYKYITQAEDVFRTLKIGHLEMLSTSTVTNSIASGRILVVMLAYIMERELDRCWQKLGLTVAEGIDELSSIRSVTVNDGDASQQIIPQAEGIRKKLLEAADVKLPYIFTVRKVQVDKVDVRQL